MLIADDELHILPFRSIGAGGHDYLWMSHLQELYTGGLDASPLVVPHHTDTSKAQLSVLFSSHSLEKNFHHMLDLWSNIINRLVTSMLVKPHFRLSSFGS